MLVIVAVLAQYLVPRSTIDYYNYRSQDMFRSTSNVSMTVKFKLKNNVPQFILNKWVGVQAARKGNDCRYQQSN